MFFKAIRTVTDHLNKVRIKLKHKSFKMTMNSKHGTEKEKKPKTKKGIET